jgi:hypothetical protein
MKVILTLVALSLLLATPAHAADATREEVMRLGEDAAFDDDAFARLQEIDSIDGEPVDMERLIADADRTQIEERISTLFAEDLPEPRDPSDDRADAELVLEQDRYQPEDIPRPFRGPLEWIADRLGPIGDAIGSFFGWIVDVFAAVAQGTPGGAATLWTLIGLAVVMFVFVQTRRVIKRRGRTKASEIAVGEMSRSDDPRELEREAAAARSRGDHALEVRLLFRAGVIRLARARVIPARYSLTTGEIRRLLHSGDFDLVGRSFDEIAYGNRPATTDDGDAARQGWARVLDEVDR